MRQSVLTILASAALVAAQTRSVSSTIEATGTAASIPSFITDATSVPTGQACSVVSSILAEQTEAPIFVRADLANECLSTVPIDKGDALRLIDGVVAALQFQSDVGHLANPPEGYLLAGVDLFGEISDLRSQVDSGDITNEIDFERNFTAILGKAQDGHLNFLFDGLSTFVYQRLSGSLVSVSLDGTSEPKIYLRDELLAFVDGGPEPSAVIQINGQDVAEFLQERSQNISYGGLQDPDALYNQMMFSRNSGSPGQASSGLFRVDTVYPGAETIISFENNTSVTDVNLALYNSIFSFDGLEDGETFYNLYCNATAKAEALGYSLGGSNSSAALKISPVKKKEMVREQKKFERRIKRQEPTATNTEISPVTSTTSSVSQTATQILGYPTPVVLSDDLSLSGYFLEDSGFEDVAVLVLQSMSEVDPEGFQTALTSFMDQCRSQNKKQLVLDVQGNPGGTISLGYEVFKQLFPDVFPYGAGTLRAHEGLDTLGQYYTNFSTQLAQQYPDNVTVLAANDYYLQYNAKAYASSDGQLFETWEQLYGPVQTPDDNFTNLVRWNINDTNFNLASGNIVISGFGNNTDVAPSPFTSENIILLSDGRCSSTCTILAHLLKWQGKVKSVAMGGRPDNGAMQAVGGVKGSQVYQYLLLANDVYYAYQGAFQQNQNDIVQAIESSSTLNPIANDSDYVVLRGANAGSSADALSDFQFNWQNNVAEGDSSYTPLQFVYEAADCRLWYQPSHIAQIETLWATVAAQAFGINNTDTFSLCVEGSTNAPSSLSGNATLFNNGNPTNVTTFLPEQQGDGNGGSGSGSGSGSDNNNNNAASRYATSSVAVLVAVAAAVFAI